MAKSLRKSALFRSALAAFFTGVVLGLPAAHAESAAQSQQKAQEFTSYLGYQLKPAHFQPAYREIIKKINDGSAAPGKQAPLQQALRLLAEREKTETRGRIDIVYFLEGYAWEKLGKNREALAAYERAVREKPQSPLYVFRHALLLKQSGNCGRAIGEFEQIAWEVKQASHEPLFLAGECREALGQADEAKRNYTEAVKRNPKYAPALRKVALELAKQLEEEHDPKKKSDLEAQFKTVLETIVQHDPADRVSTLRLAEMYLNSPRSVLNANSFSRAGELVKPFVTASSFADDQAVRILFESQRRLGNASEANDTLKKGLAAKPSSEVLLAAGKQLELEQQLQAVAPDSR